MIAALAGWHEQHGVAAAALAGIDVLPARVVLETYSVLTRLPGGLAIAPAQAAQVLAQRFHRPPLRLDERERGGALASAGVFGGARYDGLVALEARAHGRTLLTLDERAQATYRKLGAAFAVLGA